MMKASQQLATTKDLQHIHSKKKNFCKVKGRHRQSFEERGLQKMHRTITRYFDRGTVTEVGKSVLYCCQ